jgi:DinB superfamily
MEQQAISNSLREKVIATVERTEHLVSLVPADRLNWRPSTTNGSIQVSDLGHLLGHLLDCLAGFCAVFYTAFPAELASLAELRSARVNHSCHPEEWRARVKIYRSAIDAGFQQCADKDLSRLAKTVFRPEGQTVASLLFGNLEHLINHKYQLFFYLKILGVPVGTPDLYDSQGKS